MHTRPHFPDFPQAIQPRSRHHNCTGFRVWKWGAERQPWLPPSRKTRSCVPNPLLTCGGRPSAGPRICSAGRDGASGPWAGREVRVESLGIPGSYPPERRRQEAGRTPNGRGRPRSCPARPRNAHMRGGKPEGGTERAAARETAAGALRDKGGVVGEETGRRRCSWTRGTLARDCGQGGLRRRACTYAWRRKSYKTSPGLLLRCESGGPPLGFRPRPGPCTLPERGLGNLGSPPKAVQKVLCGC